MERYVNAVERKGQATVKLTKRLSGEGKISGIPPQLSSGSFRIRSSANVHGQTETTATEKVTKQSTGLLDGNLLQLNDEIPRPDPAISPSATINFITEDDNRNDIFFQPNVFITNTLTPTQFDSKIPKKQPIPENIPIQFQYGIRKVFEDCNQTPTVIAASENLNLEKNLNLDCEVIDLMENLSVPQTDNVEELSESSEEEQTSADQVKVNDSIPQSLINIDSIVPADRPPLVIMDIPGGLKVMLQFAEKRTENIIMMVITTTNHSSKSINNYSFDACASRVRFYFFININ